MRGGSLGVQQALTPEAGNMVKQAMVLASQRGHAQVTPLHVATTMLSAATGLLRAACLQSHTHPLQCRALELCFNVSLNRLQTSTRSSMLVVPCISNSLFAAFKRAQAHNRRGSLENQQQQPILAVKIEPEQLVISILDDPGVSRVMREAGFSSPQVKSKVEQYVSLKMCSDKPTPNISSSSSSSSLNTSNPTKPDSRLFVPKHNNELATMLVLNSAASYRDAKEEKDSSRFKEMNAENLRTLCDALRSKAPRHKDVIPDIANTILKCRTRSIPRKLGDGNQKEETWLYFQGEDVESKEKIGKELAKLVFGSHNSFVSISLSSSSTEDLEKKKRKRDEDSFNYTQRLFEAVSCDPHRVFFVEDIEEADYLCQMGFKRAIERGKLQNRSGEEALLKDAIVILSSTERFSSKSRASSSLDLNLSLDHDGHRNDHIGLLDTVDAHILFKGSSI